MKATLEADGFGGARLLPSHPIESSDLVYPCLLKRLGDFLKLSGVFVGAFLVSSASAQTSVPTPKFYAYCVEVGLPGVTPAPLAKQTQLLRDLGFDGVGYELWLDDTLEPNLRLIENAGLQLYLVWTSVNVNPAQPAFDPRLPAALRALKGRPVTVSVLLRGFKPGDPQGIAPAIKVLRELGELAAGAGVRVSIYNHVSDWAESLPFIVELVQRVNHPQVGFNFNLCHWLKVDGARDWRPWLREHAAKLFCVTINGATIGAETWTNGLIRPLDEGDFDNRTLLATLREVGYRGPIGLMCYGVPGDPREHLARSIQTWRKLLPQ